MDIDYPANIVERVNDAVAAYERRFDGRVVVDVVGHGAAKYSDALASIQLLGDIVDESVARPRRAWSRHFRSTV